MIDRFSRAVGMRYLRARQGGSAFLSVISSISVGGVAVGVTAMIVILSVMAGFESEMKKRLFNAESHLRIEAKQGNFRPEGAFLEKLRKADPRIQELEPVLQTEVVLKSGRRVSGAVVKGLSDRTWERVRKQVVDWAASAFLSDGRARLLVGQELAYELGLAAGDVVTAVSPVEVDGPLGLAPRMKTFVVEGIYKSGVPEQELHLVYALTPDVESFLRQAGEATHLEGMVGALDDAPEVASALASQAGEQYLVRSWQDMNAHLVFSLQLERAVMSCMLAFITVVATFNILSVLTMTVIEKKRSVSILRAMGAAPSAIARIFLWQALSIAAVGSFIGAALGLGACWVLKTFSIFELPEVYYDRTLPVQVDPWTITIILVATHLIVVAGALLPSRRASAITPLAGIRS